MVTRRKFELADILKLIRNGHGQGRFESYVPWMKIRRHFTSPVSKQAFCQLGLRQTSHHLLSLLEYKTALINAWLQPLELRECLPLWPTDHDHPNSGLGAEWALQFRKAEGLVDIARRAGIDHGCYVGTKLPYIATADLVFLTPTNEKLPQLTFISVKSQSELESRSRARERIELERLYAEGVGARHIVETGENIPTQLVRNLRWMIPLRSEILALRDSERYLDFCREINVSLVETPVDRATTQHAKRLGLSPADGHLHFRMGCWLGNIDIDLNRPFVATGMAVRDGGSLRAKLKKTYWGP